jgi:hypothetical protein
MYLYRRYLGLFGDHIVPAVLYHYTQVLRCPDLVNSKAKPLVSIAKPDFSREMPDFSPNFFLV